MNRYKKYKISIEKKGGFIKVVIVKKKELELELKERKKRKKPKFVSTIFVTAQARLLTN